SRHGAGGQQDCVAERLVSATASVEHPRQHGNVQIRVVINPHFAFAFVEAMQSAHILSDRSPPRNRQREEQSIETRVVESLADESSRGQNHPAVSTTFCFT